jgi:hypothetical protein
VGPGTGSPVSMGSYWVFSGQELKSTRNQGREQSIMKPLLSYILVAQIPTYYLDVALLNFLEITLSSNIITFHLGIRII